MRFTAKRSPIFKAAWFAAVALSLFSNRLPAQSATEIPLRDVFVGGQDGYPAYRIPSILMTRKGTLLAFAEARATKADHSKNKIVLRRSSDQGRTWGKIQIVSDAGSDCLNNPEAVVDQESGRVLLVFQRYPEAFHESTVTTGLEGGRICRCFVTRSDDDGASWSLPEEITASVKRPTEATSLASGPGIGIQLAAGPHKGRILLPFNQGPPGHWKVYAVFSDDHGRSWRYGDTAPEDANTGANEVQLVELTGGSVMLNARDQLGSHHRRVSRSEDGGQTWSPLADDPTLIEPRCQASILRHAVDGKRADDILLFSNPASVERRANGTVRLSRDDGKTWVSPRTIYPRGFGYSCLVSIDPETAGCLFERDNYDRISFGTFPVQPPAISPHP